MMQVIEYHQEIKLDPDHLGSFKLNKKFRTFFKKTNSDYQKKNQEELDKELNIEVGNKE